jgi:hypothetical protein
MHKNPERKPQALSLEVEALEQNCNPGCGSSTTSNKCTCPISLTTTGSLFTATTTS